MTDSVRFDFSQGTERKEDYDDEEEEAPAVQEKGLEISWLRQVVREAARRWRRRLPYGNGG